MSSDQGGVGAAQHASSKFIVFSGITKINTKSARDALPENEAAWLENLQPINAYKLRGAANAVARVILHGAHSGLQANRNAGRRPRRNLDEAACGILGWSAFARRGGRRFARRPHADERSQRREQAWPDAVDRCQIVDRMERTVAHAMQHDRLRARGPDPRHRDQFARRGEVDVDAQRRRCRHATNRAGVQHSVRERAHQQDRAEDRPRFEAASPP